ncbi:MAG: valine--tRNA ligase [Thermaerobacter sp.]|nr:valine--tRNA ligase [Thermaerobacter sp.]
MEFPKAYDPQAVEEGWYRRWLEGAYFRAEVDPDRTPFCIVIPPPNVTGILHLGHALDSTLQDILARWRRMQGYAVLWLPGTDHAGIATQTKVEEELRREGLTRQELGREAFLERVWAWKERYGGIIPRQLQRLGASCDWSRERFTLDPGLSRAVRTTFVRLYRQGLIYRGQRIINWCPRCGTALSDIEVEHRELPGHLWHIRYPAADGSGEVTVATTRPETMLGDTAVAVHPEDPRYASLVGRSLRLPLLGRQIPVVADEAVEREFGTGAVKVTPAHDPTDFQIGERHGLPRIVVIGLDARMTPEAGPFRDLDRYEARRAVVAELERQGLLEEVREHTHAVGHCSRCGTVVEPLVSDQWFVRMGPLAQPAARAALTGQVRFVPERFTRVYLNWLERVEDWCISRQLWWGHRIPAWYCPCGETVVAEEEPTRCPKCGGTQLVQDPDVLDTWFSSALWPFSTLGWPEDTPELRFFYPTAVLVTGYDIIFFWVARMIFQALKLTGQVPFRDVLIHGIVRDELGRKMSKSLGNGIDPAEVIDRYGADALRFALITGNSPGNDLRFSWERVEAGRNFTNKIWNAARFAWLNLRDFDPGARSEELELADRWILSRHHRVAAQATELLESYELGEAGRVLQEFFWGELCDWYIELVKERLAGRAPGRAAAQATLYRVLEGTLRLLHPFVPFVTEEIWHRLPGTGESLTVAAWPEGGAESYPDALERMELVQEVTRTARNLRQVVGVPPGRPAQLYLRADSPEVEEFLRPGLPYVRQLADLSVTRFIAAEAPPLRSVSGRARGLELLLPVEGLIDVVRETARLEREAAAARRELERVTAKLENPAFVAKAPAQVVEKERARRQDLGERLRKLEETLLALR